MPTGCSLIFTCLVFQVIFLIGNSLSGCKYLVPVSAWDSCPVESVVRTYLVAINLWQSSVTINLLADFYHFLLITLYFWVLDSCWFYHFSLITLYFWVLDSCWFLSLFTDYIVFLYLCMSLHISVFMHVLLFARRIFCTFCL